MMTQTDPKGMPPASRTALYFGRWRTAGHFLYTPDGHDMRPKNVPGFLWSEGLLDTGLLDNGKHADIESGRVFWTVGGKPDLWFAFFWWDRSGDKRPNSNSGFYVRGFSFAERDEAFLYACEAFPSIVARQKHPLVLQPKP